MAFKLSKNLPSVQSINFQLLKAKLFYFFFLSGMISLLPYLYLYYKHVLFLSPMQVTVLLAVRPMCLMIGAPLLGTYADKTNRFKGSIILCLCGYIVTYTCITLLEPVKGFNCKAAFSARAADHLNLTVLSNKSKEFAFLQALKTSKLDFYPGSMMEDSLYSWPFSQHLYDKTEQITHNLFVTVLVIMIAGELISSPANTFADVYTLQTLGDDSCYYGYQILPGVIGAGIVSVVLNVLTHVDTDNMDSVCDTSSILSEKPYFIQFLIFMALSLAVASIFQYHKNKPLNKEKISKVSGNCGGCKLVEAVCIILRNSFHASFMLVVLICAIADGAKTSFIYTFIADLSQNSKNHFRPLITATHFLSHLVFLALSALILKRFGHIKVIAAGMLTYAISFLVYGMINDPIWVFLVEPLDGIARQLTKVAILTYVGSPPGIGAALQGFTHAVYLGVGTSIGTFICGYLVHLYGYVIIFLVMGAACLVGFCFWLTADHYWHGDKTIAETFTLYTLVETTDSESEFDFLLQDASQFKSGPEQEPVKEEENGNSNIQGESTGEMK